MTITIPFEVFMKDFVVISLPDELYSLKHVSYGDLNERNVRCFLYERGSDGENFVIYFETDTGLLKGRGWDISKDDNGDIVMTSLIF